MEDGATISHVRIPLREKKKNTAPHRIFNPIIYFVDKSSSSTYSD